MREVLPQQSKPYAKQRSTMNTFNTSCPVVRTTREKLVEHVVFGGEPQRMDFEKDILWIRKSESTVQFIHGNKVLKEAGTYTDFYGYLTSATVTGPTPEKLAEFYGITPESSLELVVLTRIYDEPAYESSADATHNNTKNPGYKSRYSIVPDKWRTEATDEAGQKIFPALSTVEVGSGITWSSKLSYEENHQKVEAFRTLWRSALDGNLINTGTL